MTVDLEDFMNVHIYMYLYMYYDRRFGGVWTFSTLGASSPFNRPGSSGRPRPLARSSLLRRLAASFRQLGCW